MNIKTIETIHIGNRIGYYYDSLKDLKNRVKYKIKTNVILPARTEMIGRIYEEYSDFLPSKDKLLIDIGAQYADYSIIANKIYGAKVIAFEPLMVNYEKAIKYIKLNKANVNLIKSAISDREYEEEMNWEGTMLKSVAGGIKKEIIVFHTLDSYNLQPDLLKIDVEGFEISVLKGALKTITEFKPRIIIETHSSDLEKHTKEILKSLGYIEPKEGRRINGIGFMDTVVNLFFKQS